MDFEAIFSVVLRSSDSFPFQVLKRLQKRYGDMYSDRNVIISGTHTHSTPGGFLMDFLFDLPILGFVKETYSAYILGIYKVGFELVIISRCIPHSF